MKYLILLLALCSVSYSIPSPWFSAKSAWNAPLPDNAPISPNSTALVNGLVYQVKKYGPWMNVYQYSVPVYTVPANQPTVKVNLVQPPAPAPSGNVEPSYSDMADCIQLLQEDYNAVPLPPGAKPANGTDMHLALWQPTSNTMWEFWAMDKNQQTNQWQARWGGKMQSVSTNPGFYEAPCTSWGATATSLALTGGLLLINELKTGVIEHALAFAVVETQKSTFVIPAERDDGWSTTQYAIPEGTRFRLPANIDVNSLGLPPFGVMLARAIQKYGGLVRDTAGAVIASYCEPATSGPDPYDGPNGFFKGLSPVQILEKFPWDKLEVVDPSWQPWKNGK